MQVEEVGGDGGGRGGNNVWKVWVSKWKRVGFQELDSCNLPLILAGILFANSFYYWAFAGVSGGLVVKHLPASAGDVVLIPWWGGSPGEENCNPLQYSCLENSMDRGAQWATVHRVAKRHD